MKRNRLFTLIAAVVALSTSPAFAQNSAYDAAVLADHPVSYWPMQETNGPTIHDIISTNDGTLQQGTVPYARSGTQYYQAWETNNGSAFGMGGPGVFHNDPNDKAIYFTNQNATFISVPYADSLNAPKFSAEVWLNIPHFPINPPFPLPATEAFAVLDFMYNGDQPCLGWEMNVENAEYNEDAYQAGVMNAWMGMADGQDWWRTNTKQQYNNQWIHSVLTYNGTNLDLYVNGVSIATITQGYGPPSGTTHAVSPYTMLYMGAQPAKEPPVFLGQFYQGGMSHVAYYNYALSVSQINAHYSYGTNTGTPSIAKQLPSQTNSVVQMATLSMRAEVKPNSLFSDGAVLQQGVPVPVWGTANDGEKVTVKFQNQTVTTTAKDGRWMLHLKPLKAGGPFVMTIAGENTVTLSNVLVGEVWLCGGQSNMEMPLAATTNSAEAIAAARDPQLHLFTVSHGMSDEPKTEVSGTWAEAAPGSAKYFSAVAYYFGRDLRKALNVPVGLIHSSVGGTPAEAWTAHPALEKDPAFTQILERQAQAVKNFDPVKAEVQHEAAIAKAKAEGGDVSKVPAVAKSPALGNGRPSVLYNAMIAPLQPFAIAGVIWYQGEQNNWHPLEYRTLFPTLIHNWREAWGEGGFPFLFVQIAPHRDMKPEIREAQFLTWQKVPRTSMVVITDVGEKDNIHPTQKEPVGARLALAARAIAYGEKIEYSGPVYASLKVKGNDAIVSFTHLGGGLVAKDGELKGFSLAGQDGDFVSGIAKIDGNKVIVSSPSVTKPTAVRYGWTNAPDVNLFNRQGLPATPFRTDVK